MTMGPSGAALAKFCRREIRLLEARLFMVAVACLEGRLPLEWDVFMCWDKLNGRDGAGSTSKE